MMILIISLKILSIHSLLQLIQSLFKNMNIHQILLKIKKTYYTNYYRYKMNYTNSIFAHLFPWLHFCFITTTFQSN